jgi:CMP-N-acetylneuraminic acid synthetase
MRLKQMKHLKHAYETLAKKHEKRLKTIVKHTQHPDKTLATYVTFK